MTEVLAALALLSLGFFLGRGRRQKQPEPPAPEEAEARELREELAAFSQLMSYSRDRAYGREEE